MLLPPSLTHIYNSSITSGTFPINFKRAKLIPVYKRDSVHDKNNYRPISILPIISKPLERHVAKLYLGDLTSNNLIHRNQLAYCPHHSCETALLNLTDNWLKAMAGLRLWTLESLWVQCCWILTKRLTLWIMTYCYPKLTNIMSLVHLKNGLNHTLVIEHNIVALMDHCLIHWYWPEEFRKDQF